MLLVYLQERIEIVQVLFRTWGEHLAKEIHSFKIDLISGIDFPSCRKSLIL